MLRNQAFVQMGTRWLRRNFSNSGAIALLLTIALIVLCLAWFGTYLLPVLISIVFAYILLPAVRWLVRLGSPKTLAAIAVYCLFLVLYLGALFFLVPMIIRQLSSLVDYIPQALHSIQGWVGALTKDFPDFFPDMNTASIDNVLHSQVSKIGNVLLQFSLATIPGIIQAILYIVLVPVLVFFFLRDASLVSQVLAHILPKERVLIGEVWRKIDRQLAAYLRGRVVELLIIAVMSCIAFIAFGLPYPILLGVLVGVSVIVPYVGGIVVTIPVVVFGITAWGVSPYFTYFFIVYLVILGFDAYILVPVLFSGAMNMHPIIIIASVVLFGGLFGFWGVFFAIPLASVIQTILLAWPQTEETDGIEAA